MLTKEDIEKILAQYQKCADKMARAGEVVEYLPIRIEPFAQAEADPEYVMKTMRDCSRLRYAPVFEQRTDETVNRLGSVIGDVGFTSEDHPWPMTSTAHWLDGRHLDEPLEEKRPAPMMPLVQLDLSQISRATGRNVGSGLLQCWLAPDTWGQEVQTTVRHIPERDLGAPLGPDLPTPVKQIHDAWEKRLAEIELEYELNPDVNWESLCQEDIYWHGVLGFDWSKSPLIAYELQGCRDVPVQITGWRKAGYAWPPDILNEYGGGFRSLERKQKLEPYVLFETLYDNEYMAHGQILDGWRVLFSFLGPACSDLPEISDSHAILYRKPGADFEYMGIANRWVW